MKGGLERSRGSLRGAQSTLSDVDTTLGDVQTALGQAQTIIAQAQRDVLSFTDAATSAYVQGATLLADSAGGYVLVGVASFTAAAVLTVVCMRLHEREKREKNNETDKEGNAS